MKRFVGRQRELAILREQQKKQGSSLVVIKGRRRIGKSRLAHEFSHNFDRALLFTGLPPRPNISAKKEQEEFELQLYRYKIPVLRTGDWGDLFWSLAESCKQGSVLIVLDEISWMGSKDPDFLGKLKIIWDQYFSQNPKLMLILSGSHSTWIEQNIISSTGFLGRISRIMDLKELPLEDCHAFWDGQIQVSPYEIFKVLGITGGIPRYLEEIQPRLTAEENIRRLCFQPEGLLFNEFDQIFSDLFSRRNAVYKQIVKKLVDGPKSLIEIAKTLNKQKSGDLSSYMDDLCQTGFLSRDFTWNLQKGQESKLSRYRLSDNYVRFYLKYIDLNKRKIKNQEIIHLPHNWLSIMGLQFENLVINNRLKLYKLLNVPPNEVVAANPFFQSKTVRQQGCQIDFLIQTRYKTLYLCEIKFSSSEIPAHIIPEVKKKVEKLCTPKGFSIRPVLIHVNGVADSVIQQGYFAEIVNFSALIN